MKKFEPKLLTVDEIFKNGVIIPKFQRKYEWTEEMAIEFLNSILTWTSLEYKEENLKHRNFTKEYNWSDHPNMFYIGQIVNSEREIVDGQQRLTTTLIILKAIYDLLLIENAKLSDKNKIGTNTWYQVFFDNDEKLRILSTKLDRVNSERLFSFETNISNLTLDKKNDKDFISSCFYKNYIAVFSELKKWIKGEGSNEEKAIMLNNLKTVIQKNVRSTVIPLTTDEDALSFFEVLNSKSAPLAASDLLKNNFIKTQIDADRAADVWNDIEESMIEYKLDMTKYIRYLYIAKMKYIEVSKLFKTIAELKSEEKTHFNLTLLMEDYKQVFISISSLESQNIKINSKLNLINGLGPKEALMPVLLELFKSFSDNEVQIEKILNYLIKFSIIYYVISGNKTNEYSKYIPMFCKRINMKLTDPTEIFMELENILLEKKIANLSYADFDEKLNESSDKTKFQISKHIYPLLLNSLINGDYDTQEGIYSIPGYGHGKLDLEHIYPKKPNDKWTKLTDPNLVNNIGNLIPIGSTKNRKSQNSNFKTKYDIYTGKGKDNGSSKTWKILFLDIVENANSELIWSDEAIEKRGKKILELIKDNDILYLNSGNK